MKQPTMMVVETFVEEQKSFRLIPISIDSPYIEAMYHPDPNKPYLKLISKTTFKDLRQVYARDSNGKRIPLPQKQKGAPIEFKTKIEEFDNNYQYHIIEGRDIINFIKRLTGTEVKLKNYPFVPPPKKAEEPGKAPETNE